MDKNGRKKQDELRKEVIIMVISLWTTILEVIMKIIEVIVKAFS